MSSYTLRGATIAVLLAAVDDLYATNQEWERLRYQGVVYFIADYPLSNLWHQSGNSPTFDPTRTSNWSGYTAGWEITDGKLYLVSFEAKKRGWSVSVSDFLPGRSIPLFAEWYTGPIQIPIGEPIDRPGRSPYDWVYENVIVLEIEDGVVVKKTENKNAKVDLYLGAGRTSGVSPIAHEYVDPDPLLRLFLRTVLTIIVMVFLGTALVTYRRIHARSPLVATKDNPFAS